MVFLEIRCSFPDHALISFATGSIRSCLRKSRCSATDLPMTTHRFIATEWHNTIGTHPPAITIASGDIVITETIDAHGIDKDGRERAPEPNPMNGPIFVTGAEPGDALKVEILRMTPIRATGWTRGALAANVVDPQAEPPAHGLRHGAGVAVHGLVDDDGTHGDLLVGTPAGGSGALTDDRAPAMCRRGRA